MAKPEAVASSLAALHDSPAAFRLLADNVTDCAIYLLDPQGHVATWNAGAKHLKQYAADEIIGQHYSCFYLPADVAAGRPEAELTEALARDKTEGEAWRQRKDGSRFKAHIMAVPLHDAAGRHMGFARVTRDLSAGHNLAQLRMVLHDVLDGIVSFCDQGIIQSFNRAAQHIFGYTEAEALGRNVRELLPPFCAVEIDNLLSSAPETMAPQVIGKEQQASGLRKDGCTFPMDLTVSEFSLDGERYFTGVVRDVTERENNEARRHAILDNVSDLIVMVDRQGLIRSANRAAEDLSGYTVAELIGQPISMLTPDDQRPQVIALETRMFSGEISRATGLDVIGRSKDGTLRPLELSLNAFMLGAERYIIGVARDITERKQAEAALLHSNQRMAKAQRVAHVGDWEWDVVSHQSSWSDEYYRIMGLEPQSFAPDFAKAMELVHPDDRARINTVSEQGRLHGGSTLVDYRIVRPDGEIRYVEGRGEFPAVTAVSPESDEKCIISGTLLDVTERVQSELRLRAILDNASDAIMTADDDGIVQSFNRAAEGMYGYSAAEIIGQEVFVLSPPDQRDDAAAMLARMSRSEQVQFHSSETRGMRKDGSIFPREIALTAVTVDNKHLIVGLIRDITERKAEQDALLLSKKRMEDAQELAQIGNWEVDLASGAGSWSPELYRIYGKPPDVKVELATSLEWSHPDDRERVQTLMQAAAKLAGDFHFEYRILRPAGELRYLEARGETLLGSAGTPVLMRGTVQDITDRVLANAALRLSQERMESAQREAQIGDWEWDIALDHFSVSDEFFRLYGLEPQSLVLDLAAGLELIHPEDRERVAAEVGAVMANGTSHRFEYRLLRPDGELRYVDGRCAVVPGPDGRPAVLRGTLQDITERKLAQQESEKLGQQLRQSQKMEAVGKLAGGVAHDFNNMLTVINAYSMMALEELPPGHALREYLSEIQHAGERAALLTSQLLAFSRQQVLAPRVLSLNAMVVETEKMLQRLIGEDIKMITNLDPQLSHIRVDQGQIVQVIMNLAVNARDAMPQGGKLTIETRNLHIDAERAAQLPDCRPGPFVMLSVVDNGAGMTPEVKNRVFEPFYTTKGPGEGTGLGLSTVYGIIKQSGGNIEVYSEVGVGTAFKIYFRAVDADAAHQQLADVAAPAGGSETILLVEDDVAVRQVAVAVLEKKGYALLVAGSARDAIELARNHTGHIDLLLTDLIMPELSGRQVAEAATVLLPTLKVLYMSGYTDDAVVRHGLATETVAFLQKPFTSTTLALKVREVLDAGGGLAGAARDADAALP